MATRRALAVLTAFALVLAVGAGRSLWEGRSALSRAREAEAAGEWEQAVREYRHSAEWYVPVAGTGERALEALARIAEAREDASDTEGALFALRSARAAIMSTRSLWTPHAERLEGLHAGISRLMAQQTVLPGDPVDVDGRVAAEREFRAQLDSHRDRRPNPIPGFAGSLAFALWLGSLFALAWKGLDAEGRLRRGPLVRWGGVSLGLLVAWCLLLRFA